MASSSVPWKVVSLGIDPETPLDLAIARRATNVAALGMTIVALTSAAASLLDAHSALLAAGCLAFAVAYATCLLLNAVGRLNFDVWGETVNLARQMEMTGMRGRIQVSESTYWRLRGGYRFEPRGEVEVKSGGPLSTYFLLGRGLTETASAVHSLEMS